MAAGLRPAFCPTLRPAIFTTPALAGHRATLKFQRNTETDGESTGICIVLFPSVTGNKRGQRMRARKRESVITAQVKIIHRSRREIFSQCKYSQPREKNDLLRWWWNIEDLRGNKPPLLVCSIFRRERQARRDKTYATGLWCIRRGERGFAAALRDFWKYFPFVAWKKKFPRAGKLPRTSKEDATNFCLRRRRLPRTYSSRMNHNAWAPSKTDSADIKFPRHRWPLDRLSRMATMREITCSRDILSCAQEIFFVLRRIN